MNGVIFWGGVSSVFLLLFILLLAFGIIRQQKKLVFAAVAAFMLSLFAGAVTLAELAGRAIDIVKEKGKQPSPAELYERAVGVPPPPCVKVGFAEMSDNPVTSKKLTLCFSSCPAEAKRILSLMAYDIAEVPTTKISERLGETGLNGCFGAARFGDSVLHGLSQGDDYHTELLMARDSTHVLLVLTWM